MAGARNHIGCLASDGSVDSLLKATLEKGAQIAGTWQAEVSSVDLVAGVGRATRGA